MFNIQIQLFTLQVQEMKDTHIARYKIVHYFNRPSNNIEFILFVLFLGMTNSMEARTALAIAR